MKFSTSKLREARGQKRLTLKDMAKYMDIDISAYWRLEAGETKVKAEQLVMFMKLFDQPYAYFFDPAGTSSYIKLNVECRPEKLQVLFDFLKAQPGIIKDWEQNLLKIEQELHMISF